MSEGDTGRDFATRVGATPARRGGRALASFATLLALAALGLAGYPYYQRYVVGVPAVDRTAANSNRCAPRSNVKLTNSLG